ncbi:FIST N-terminal domain-containing protein [Sulfurimonas sp.]|uniref:FIST N-terminal domain-containing protein n=1 Tax=Sulfurimonas sp. TaxID=2022749 RepID=UPI003D10A2AC
MIQNNVHIFIDLENLAQYISKNIIDSDKLLIQAFFKNADEKYISSIREKLHSLLPQAHIIGTSTDGAIHSATHDFEQTVISFTLFEKSFLKHKLFKFIPEHEEECAKQICEQLFTDKTKVAIMFAEGIFCNAEKILKYIHNQFPNVILSGGAAGDNAALEKTYVCDSASCDSMAVVVATIESDSLIIHNDYNLSWRAIGPKMNITKGNDATIYEIDYQPAKQIYDKYLGNSKYQKYGKENVDVPSVGIEFPFLINRGGMPIARAAFRYFEDGSILFGGNILEGDTLQFSVGDVQAIIQSGQEFYDKLKFKPIETIFIYSCMARRRFLEANITHDIAPLTKLAPISGFYGYGEFFTDDESVEFLNHTMTVLALSEEDDTITYNSKFDNAMDMYGSNETVNTLINLLNNMSIENEVANSNSSIKINQECVYYFEHSELKKNDTAISLTKKEKQLLDLLLEERKQIVSFETIEYELWPDKQVSPTTRRTLIHRLREKVGGDTIKTIKDVGCKLDIE